MIQRADTHGHWLLAGLLAVVLATTALIVSPSAVAKFGSNEPCVASNGLPLNQVYRVPGSIVTPVCIQARTGEKWSPSVPWIMNTGFERVPPGFASNWATPVDDFRGKLKSVEYVIDPGSPHSFNRSFANSNLLWQGELPQAPGLPAVNTLSLSIGVLDGLPAGQHSVDVYWDFSEMHCDGFATNQAASCLPAGRTLVKQLSFNVAAPSSVKS